MESAIAILTNKLNDETTQKSLKENELINLNARLTELENIIQEKDEKQNILKQENENTLVELERARKEQASLVLKPLLVLHLIHYQTYID